MKLSLRGVFGLVLALALAIVVAVVLVKNKSPLEHVAAEMPRRAVEVIVARQLPFRTRITAYGNVEPAITLNSMAEVSGKISYVHPNLKAGETIPAGTLVVRIEAEDYARSLQQTREDLKASRSALAELEAEVKSTRRSFELARENLVVGEAELAQARANLEVTRYQFDALSPQVVSAEAGVTRRSSWAGSRCRRRRSSTAPSWTPNS